MDDRKFKPKPLILIEPDPNYKENKKAIEDAKIKNKQLIDNVRRMRELKGL